MDPTHGCLHWMEKEERSCIGAQQHVVLGGGLHAYMTEARSRVSCSGEGKEERTKLKREFKKKDYN